MKTTETCFVCVSEFDKVVNFSRALMEERVFTGEFLVMDLL